MRTPSAIIACLAVSLMCSGCAVIAYRKPMVDNDAFRLSPPKTIAVLPFRDQSRHPVAATAARDALFYALAERGYQVLDLRGIDLKLQAPQIAGQMRREDGSLDSQATGRLLGADAIATGDVSTVRTLPMGFVDCTRIDARVWLIDAQSQKHLWAGRASALTRVPKPLVRLPSLTFRFPIPVLRSRHLLTPTEKRQEPLLRTCRSFDALMAKLVRTLPPMIQESEGGQLIRSIVIRTARPVAVAGDRVDIVVEAPPECAAQAVMGTLGKVVPLKESGPGKKAAAYRGTYIIEPGDSSGYCRVAVMVSDGSAYQRKVADQRSIFAVDTLQPDPPVSLTHEVRPTGVLVKWAKSPSPEVTSYLVYRSEVTSVAAAVLPLAQPEVNQHEDRSPALHGRYSYFAKAVDYAGNPSSSSAEIIVEAPPLGPTTVGGKIEGEQRWTERGSPYRLSLDVDVTTGSTLVIEPGTQIEIRTGLDITIHGTVLARGSADAPIRVIGEEASRGFYLADPRAVLWASHVEISGAQRGAIEVADGECYLDLVELRDNRIGLNAERGRRVEVSNSRIAYNRAFGMIAGPNCVIRNCEFVKNTVGLRVVTDGVALDHCRFDNGQLDIIHLGGKPLAVDNNTFWTADPSELFRHLWGNVTCRSVLARRFLRGGNRQVQFEPVKNYVALANDAANRFQWKRALDFYEAALIQARDRDIIDKALTIYRQLPPQDAASVTRQIEFCQSAIFVYPNDVDLLNRLAELYLRQNRVQMAREIWGRVLKIDPANETAKKGFVSGSAGS